MTRKKIKQLLKNISNRYPRRTLQDMIDEGKIPEDYMEIMGNKGEFDIKKFENLKKKE